MNRILQTGQVNCRSNSPYSGDISLWMSFQHLIILFTSTISTCHAMPCTIMLSTMGPKSKLWTGGEKNTGNCNLPSHACTSLHHSTGELCKLGKQQFSNAGQANGRGEGRGSGEGDRLLTSSTNSHTLTQSRAGGNNNSPVTQ